MYCNACGWNGEPITVPVCPACRTGHRRRLMSRKSGKEYECPNCSLRGPPDTFLMEKECPNCGNQHLYESEEAYMEARSSRR